MGDDTATGQLDPPVQSLARLLTRASRAVTALVEEVLKPEGLGLDHWLVLEALAERRGLVMADLAAETMVTGPTLTRVVDRLVTNAIAFREVDPGDRRKVRVYLSPRGRATHKRIAAKVGKVERDLLGQTETGAVLDLLARLGEHP